MRECTHDQMCVHGTSPAASGRPDGRAWSRQDRIAGTGTPVVLRSRAGVARIGEYRLRRRVSTRGYGRGGARRAACELESVADSHVNRAVVLCDRGTVDGVAYWPGPPGQFWTSVQTTIEAELGRYDAVIHLRTPAKDGGYNHQNPLRIESATVAADIDARILEAWENHPRRFIVESSVTFMEKATRALEILRLEVPECCRARVAVVPDVLVIGDRVAGHETP